MGKHRALMILGIAVAIALISSLLAYSWLKTKSNEQKGVALETQPLLVAAAPLTWGTVLTKEMVRPTTVLKTSFAGAGFSDPSMVTGRVLISNVKAGEPIFESMLAPTTVKAGGIAAVITPAKRAIAVKVDKTIGVAGFIHPGNRVDVLVSFPASGGKGLSEPVTKTILGNMLVLTVGPEIDPKTKEPSNVDVITLEGTPEETEKVALASVEGKIQLVLRNFSDSGMAVTKGTTIPTLLTSYAPGKEGVRKAPTVKSGAVKPRSPEEKKTAVVSEEKKPVAAAAPTPPPYVVEMIKGGKVTEVKF